MTQPLDPNDVTVVERYLTRARSASEYRTAIQELEAAVAELESLDRESRRQIESTVWSHYAIVAERFGDWQTAIRYTEVLVRGDPDNSYSQLALARLYGELGDHGKAADSLRRCGELAEKSGDKRVLAVLATKGYLPKDQDSRARRLADAVEIYREPLGDSSQERSAERRAGAQQLLGGLYRAQAEMLTGRARSRKLEEALASYREALKVYTAEAYPEQNRGLRATLGDIEKLLSLTSHKP
jgi:tetratricopeptide (TPR) repeat protein